MQAQTTELVHLAVGPVRTLRPRPGPTYSAAQPTRHGSSTKPPEDSNRTATLAPGETIATQVPAVPDLVAPARHAHATARSTHPPTACGSKTRHPHSRCAGRATDAGCRAPCPSTPDYPNRLLSVSGARRRYSQRHPRHSYGPAVKPRIIRRPRRARVLDTAHSQHRFQSLALLPNTSPVHACAAHLLFRARGCDARYRAPSTWSGGAGPHRETEEVGGSASECANPSGRPSPSQVETHRAPVASARGCDRQLI